MIQLEKSKWQLTYNGWEYEEILQVTNDEYKEFIDGLINSKESWCEEVTSEGYCTVTINENYKIRFLLVSEKKQRGGARTGAGRKRGGRSVTLSITIKPENKGYLEQRAKETGLTVTEVLEAIIETFIDEHK